MLSIIPAKLIHEATLHNADWLLIQSQLMVVTRAGSDAF